MSTIVEMLSQHIQEGKPVIVVAATPCEIGEVFQMGGPNNEFIQNVRAIRVCTKEEYVRVMSYMAKNFNQQALDCNGFYFYEVESD